MIKGEVFERDGKWYKTVGVLNGYEVTELTKMEFEHFLRNGAIKEMEFKFDIGDEVKIIFSFLSLDRHEWVIKDRTYNPMLGNLYLIEEVWYNEDVLSLIKKSQTSNQNNQESEDETMEQPQIREYKGWEILKGIEEGEFKNGDEFVVIDEYGEENNFIILNDVLYGDDKEDGEVVKAYQLLNVTIYKKSDYEKYQDQQKEKEIEEKLKETGLTTDEIFEYLLKSRNLRIG